MVKSQPYKKQPILAYSLKGMVSTASGPATEAGVKILEKGGNAIDAAVAVAFCIGVTEFQASGIGGQTMVLMHLAKENRTIALDGSSRAPYRIDPRRIPKEPLRMGIRATTVPSTPAVLGYLLEKYGTLSLEEVIEPAIVAAEEGFKVTALQHYLLTRESEKLLADPLIAEVYFKGKQAVNAGEILRQPLLAQCLKRMSNSGWRDFYLGEIAEKILMDMEERDGLLTITDLNRIPIPIERPILSANYRDLNLQTFPPPGAGKALVQILNILENFSPEELSADSPQAPIIMAYAFKAALQDRKRLPVDPALYLQSEERYIIGKEYAYGISERIKNHILKGNSGDFSPPKTAGETTHLSVIDQEKNMVGITQSIELVCGSKTLARGLGFFYNNYMCAYDYKDMTHPYYLLPSAVPWSSVAPTIVYKNGDPLLLLGSPGSERISTSLAQVIIRLFDGKQQLHEAIAAPRLHASPKGTIHIEAKRFLPEVISELESLGFTVTKRGAYSFYLGCVQAVMAPHEEQAYFCGAADVRRDGTASGPK